MPIYEIGNFSETEVLFPKKIWVLVNISYWMPDNQNILQEFIWQTRDIEPTYPRINRFLLYWKDNIEPVINDISLVSSSVNNYRYTNFDRRI